MTTQLAPAPVFKAFDNNGNPLFGGQLFTYAAGTTTPQATYTDSTQTTQNANPVILNSRGEANVWLVVGQTYKLVLQDASGNQIWAVDQIQGGIPLTTAATIGAALYPQSPAEVLGSVTPVALQYPYGDLRRYGAIAGTADVTTPFQLACSQAQQPGGAPVYIPSALGTGHTISSGVTLTSPVTIYGDGAGSTLTAAADLTAITVNGTAASGVSGFVFRNFSLIGKGAGATLPGIQYTNANNNLIDTMIVQGFGIGVQYSPGLNSSYLNSIRSSQIIKNNTININAQKATNVLTLFGCTLGGGPANTAVKVVDSNGLVAIGCDVEGMTLCCYDLDNASFVNPQSVGGHLISGGDMEGNTCTAGDIRIGNTHTVVGVEIGGGMVWSPNNGDDSAVNVVNGIGVSVKNIFLNAGYSGSSIINGWLRLGAGASGVIAENVNNVSAAFTPFQMFGTAAASIGGALSVGAALTVKGNIGVNGAAPQAQITGFGAPTGNAVVANFPGASATLVQCSNTIAEILAILLRTGIIGA